MIGQRLRRIRRMPAVEVRWRARVAARAMAQRATQRLRRPRWDRHVLGDALSDVATADARGAIAAGDWESVQHALMATLRGRPARFVLDPGTCEDVRVLIGNRWPSAIVAASERADRVAAGRYDILGYRDVRFSTPDGAPEDWHVDPIHGRSAPLLLWADVPYLDPAIGDHKIIWEVNRHQHWLQLGRALWLTGNRRYGDAIVEKLHGWLASNPPLIGVNWASMLEIALRSISWVWALHFLLTPQWADHPDSRASRDPWLVDLLVAIDRQLRHVEQNLSHYFSPNTHLTGEALALYVAGVALPELAASAQWVRTGRNILTAEVSRQLLADGGHVERSTHYQRYTLDFYLLALLTARVAGDTKAVEVFADACSRLAEFTRTIADDGGRLPTIGDDDGGMLWPLTGRDPWDVRDSLALAAIVLDRPELAPWGATEEVVWLGERPQPVPPVPVLRSTALLATGYVVMRDGIGGSAVFDVGSHGYLNGGHAHADALAVTLALGNRPLLIDPGTCTYTMDAMWRDRFRSSMSHNTVSVDGQSQAIPAGPFHWKTRADAHLQAWRRNPTFDFARAHHEAYGDVRHGRTLFRDGRTGWLVIDEIEGAGTHTGTAHWHFDPAWNLVHDSTGLLRASHHEGPEVWLLCDGGSVDIFCGDETTGLGWHAPAYGMRIPTMTARVTRREEGPFSMTTWIGAADDSPPRLERILRCDQSRSCIGARLRWDGRESLFALSHDGQTIAQPDLEARAAFLHYETAQGMLTRLDLVDVVQVDARKGWLTIEADHIIPDLHVSLCGTTLDLVSSTPPGTMSVSGGVLARIQMVRLNGRELQPRLASELPVLLIRGGEWNEEVQAVSLGAPFA